MLPPAPTLIEFLDRPDAERSVLAQFEGGKTIHSEETTAFIEVELSPGGADSTTAVRGTALAELGARALDDFFTLFTSLHDDLAGARGLRRRVDGLGRQCAVTDRHF